MTNRSTSWALFAVLAAALATTACGKKNTDTKPPEEVGGGDADGGGDAGGGGGGGEEKADGADFLTVDVFEEVLVANTDDVAECYSDTKEKKKDLAGGKLIVDFTIGGDGMVSEIKADDSSSVKDEDLNACIKEKTKGWKFPKTRDGQPMTLPYTFSMGG